MRFDRRLKLDELAEDHDPRAFPSERARQRNIKADRWAGRHPVLITLGAGVLAAVAAYFAWQRTTDGHIGWLVAYELMFVTAFVTGSWRVSMKARKRYYRRH